MSTDANKALVYRYFDERWNRKNPAVIDELLGDGMDADDAKRLLETMHAAIGDLDLSMGDLIAEGELVVVPWTVTGIHQAELMGVGPTGRGISFSGLARTRVVDGKIVSDEAYSDLLDVLTGTS
jgi:predicted ester cyclase